MSVARNNRVRSLTSAFVLLLMAVLAPVSRAQDLFDGLPEPSMDNYAIIWEDITGLPFQEDSSSLVLGQPLDADTVELVVVQTGEDPQDTTVAVGGGVDVLSSYPTDWLLPYNKFFSMTDGPNAFDVEAAVDISVVSAFIATDTGVSSPIVAMLATTTVEIVGGAGPDVVIGETGTVEVLVPLGYTTADWEADQIAQRIAAFDVYEGDPIDPNVLPLEGGSHPAPDLTCAEMCQNELDTAMDICSNNLQNDLSNCANNAGLAAGGGCAVGAGLCLAIPGVGLPFAPACCAVGAVVGGAGELLRCTANAQNDYDTCIANAEDNYRLCMLNNCGIHVKEE